MTMYYVATLSRFVLVDAATEDEARLLGQPALDALDPNTRVVIRTVRPATDDEVELWRWQQWEDANPDEAAWERRTESGNR